MVTTPKVVPAIIPESFTQLTSTLKSVKKFTKHVQIDIVDGKFVTPTSWPYKEKGTIGDLKKYTEQFEIEMDLMIAKPEEVLEEYLKTGIKKVIIHLEAVENYNKLICLKHEYDYELGLSINNDTPLEMLLEHIGDANYLQFMGIKEIGAQGNPFDKRVLERISIVKQAYPEFDIAVDGSVNKDTIPKLGKAGANRFAVGSAILAHKSPEKAHTALTKLADKHVL